MTTTTKGMIGVTAVLADLTAKGYLASLPVSEHSHFDLIITKGDKHKTVQVKYREIKEDTLEIKLSSVWSNKRGAHTVPMNKDLIDILAIYCPETQKCYYVNPKDYKATVTLRIPTENNPIKSSYQNNANDFLNVPF